MNLSFRLWILEGSLSSTKSWTKLEHSFNKSFHKDQQLCRASVGNKFAVDIARLRDSWDIHL